MGIALLPELLLDLVHNPLLHGLVLPLFGSVELALADKPAHVSLPAYEHPLLDVSHPDVAPTTGAPRVPESHFLTRDGQKTEGTSPRRYFCLQCHVQQTDVNPIIQNKFETIRQMQGK